MSELTAKVPLGGREIEMRKPTEGALFVLARVGKRMPKIENDASELSDDQRDQLIRSLGTLGDVVESMIVSDDDKDWLDEVMISGKVTAEEVMDAIRVAGEKLNGATAAKKAVAPVRRRR